MVGVARIPVKAAKGFCRMWGALPDVGALETGGGGTVFVIPSYPASKGGRRPGLVTLVPCPHLASVPPCPKACHQGVAELPAGWGRRSRGHVRPAPPRESCFPQRPGRPLPFSLVEPRPQWTEPARPARDSWPSARGGAAQRPRQCQRGVAAAEVCQPLGHQVGPEAGFGVLLAARCEAPTSFPSSIRLQGRLLG